MRHLANLGRAFLLFGGSAVFAAGDDRTYVFSTLAGEVSAGHADGDALTARFNRPTDVAVDRVGNIYVADSGNYAVRKITPAGITSTVAGIPFATGRLDGPVASAKFIAPTEIEIDPLGNLFVGDSASVRRIGTDGQVTTVAGSRNDDFSSSVDVDGPGDQARFTSISGLGLTPGGTFYVSELYRSSLRQISSSGVVSALAGSGNSGSSDGQGSAASFFAPAGIHVDAGGIAWIADTGNHAIRRVTSTGTVTTFAGVSRVSGDADGGPGVATFFNPEGITGDLAGNLYVADTGNHAIRKIDPFGTVTTLAGKLPGDPLGKSGDSDGVGRQASFANPSGLALDGAGNLYVADTSNNVIRKVTPAGVVSTVAGVSRGSGYRDARGREARFGFLSSIVVTPGGVAYVTHDHVIRRVDPDGTVSTFAGKPDEAGEVDGNGSDARFSFPHALALDRFGNLYVVDSSAIRRITPAGVVSTVAGTGVFLNPGGIAVAPDGSIWLTDEHPPSEGGSFRARLRKISPAGEISTPISQFWPHTVISAMTFGPDGTLYINDDVYGHLYLIKGTEMQVVRPVVPVWGFSPHGIAVDQEGSVFLTEGNQTGWARVAQMSPDGQTRILGGTLHRGWKDGVGSQALFDAMGGIAVDGKGNLYIASGSTVREGIVAGAPVITTQPQGATVAAGGSMQLTVVATAIPAPAYQWFRDGVAIGGANAAAYALSNVSAANTGSYSVTVSNSVGSVTSNPALVALTATPPANSGNPAGSGGTAGGGGAPSIGFLAILATLGAARGSRRPLRA